MSLLIKALEQAARDREAAAKSEGTPGADAVVSNRNVTSLPDPGGQRRAATSLSGLAQIEAQKRARASSVVQAGESGGSGVIGYLRASPVAMIGAVAVVVGIAFGIYVYIQVANPGLLARQPPPSTPAPSAPAVAGASSTPSPAAPSSAATPTPTPTAIAALPEQPASPGAGSISSPAGVPAKVAPLPAPASGTGIPAASVIGGPGAAPLEPAAPALPRAAAQQREPRELAPDAPAREAKPAPAAPVAAPAPPARERIVVSSGSPKPTMNAQLTPAYAALQSGDIEEARSLYQRVNDAEPLNIDALLGLAFIAVQENRTDDAMRQYLRILQLEPRNSVAQGAMIALVGRADPIAAETRLKQLISREPSPFLHFILGNVYADQGAWPQAQQSYFQAQALEPNNADYAYNLAVSLDHLRQSKLALNYYRRAEQLAGARGRANFNLAQARERIRSLSAQVE